MLPELSNPKSLLKMSTIKQLKKQRTICKYLDENPQKSEKKKVRIEEENKSFEEYEEYEESDEEPKPRIIQLENGKMMNQSM
jgi:hypothetical protein